jgi:microcin C transport system substrate-binding protein
MPPKSDGSGQDRDLLRKAGTLLDQAGWRVEDGKRVNDKGEQLAIEFLTFEPTFERIVAPYAKNLKLLGIDARIRRVDPAQYQRRLKDFDFDITTQRYVMRNTPGVELRSYFGSQAADLDGSLNLAGIKDPAVDALIEKVVGAKTREDMTTAARALDRTLRAGHYWVPHWYKGSHTVAYWDKFSRPETKPKYDRGILDAWWFDEAKAKAVESNQVTAGATTGDEASNESGEDQGSKVWLILGGLVGLVLVAAFFLRGRRKAKS